MFSSLYGENDVRIAVVLLVCAEKKKPGFPFRSSELFVLFLLVFLLKMMMAILMNRDYRKISYIYPAVVRAEKRGGGEN